MRVRGETIGRGYVSHHLIHSQIVRKDRIIAADAAAVPAVGASNHEGEGAPTSEAASQGSIHGICHIDGDDTRRGKACRERGRPKYGSNSMGCYVYEDALLLLLLSSAGVSH